MKRFGRPVDAAWSITDSDDVLVANTAPSFTIPSSSRHSSSFAARLSVMASITRSQSSNPSKWVVALIRPRISSAADCSSLPFSTARASCFSILPMPFCSVASSTSRATTW